MTNTKTTKRALLASVLSVVMCISMLIGSTFAWFTDTASTAVNNIQSGNLDVVLEMSYDNGETWNDAKNQTLNFIAADKRANDDILWEPGAEYKLPQLRIRNNGNLALKFKVVVSGLTGDMELANVLDVKLGGTTVDTLTNVMALNDDVDGMIHGKLAAAAPSEVYEVSLKMQESAGNTYMNKTLSGLAITVYAAQDAVENDSFGDQYDKNAAYDLILKQNERLATNDAELANILNNLEGVDTVYLAEGTFNAFNLASNSTLNFVGATNAKGKPATVISMPKAPTSFTTLVDSSMWNGFKGSVKNVSFKAASDSGLLALYSDNWSQPANAAFENCTFENMGVKISGSVDFKNCTFDGKNQAEKAIAYSVVPENEAIKLTGCTIMNYTQCGINIAESAGALIVDNCTLENCASVDDYGIHVGQIGSVKITGSTLKCNVHYYESLISSFECEDSQFAEGFSASKK